VAPRVLTRVVAVLVAFVAAGCSIGPGDSQEGGATLTITRDFGARRLVQTTVDPIPAGETVMRFLSREADVETRYGGRFVNAINRLRSGSDGGRRRDWFYFVNGIEADVGAAERELSPADRVWWDYRDWSAAMRVPAVVGSFPEPFLHGSEGKRFPVRLDCAEDADEECRAVTERMERVGIDASTTALGTPAGENVLRVLVGEWEDVRADAAARELEQGPAQSGVFARPARSGSGYELNLLDVDGRATRTLGAGTGIVAAARFEDQQPTWVVAGTDATGLVRAVRLVDTAALRDRFAVATLGAQPIPLPLPEDGSR
jgi:hypothetical protein